MSKKMIELNDEAVASVNGGTQIPHIVQNGESLSALAQKYGCTVDQLLKWNPGIADPNNISIGQKIVVKY